MDPERYARVRARFDALVDLDPDARERALADAEQDPEDLALLRQLLAADGLPTSDMAASAYAALDALHGDIDARGRVLGAWTLDETLGHGGMGTVYAAHRSDGQFDQRAAVKLLRGVPSPSSLEHLARERQILAGLVHPNIARLLDGGTTPQGQPFLVMERVDGDPIDRWCRQRSASPRTVLALLRQVCAAVAYAHAQLVVHCDLKPSNVLVDHSGRPVLLDFGIARLLEGSSADGLPSTASLRARAFTPGFSSPEQERGEAIGTAADVFSLGRVLECLLGTDTLGRDAELAAIVARATDPVPSRRYPSVSALDADLDAWLTHRPLAAMQASYAYRLRKAVRRHWPAVSTAAAALLLIALAGWQVVRERDLALAAERSALEERDRAAAAEQTARQVSDFVISILDGANPDAGGDEVPVSRLVEQALARIETELAGQPGVQAELYSTLAGVQSELWSPEAAQASFERAIALQRTLDRPLPLARSVLRLARHMRRHGSPEATQTHAREALALYEALGAEAPAGERQQAMRLLGMSLMDTPETTEGLRFLRQAVQDAEANAPEGTDLAFALLDLGSALRQLGVLDEAEVSLRRSVALFRADDEGSEETLNAQEVLARLMVARKQFVEAEALLRESLERRRALHGSDDINIPWRLSELGALLDEDGRSLEALPLYAEAVDLAASKFGLGAAQHAVLLQNQARSQFWAGALDQAVSNYRQALAVLVERWGEDHAGVASVRTSLGQLLLVMGEYAEAGSALGLAERVLAARQPGNPVDLARARVLLAEAHWRLGRQEEAQRWLALAMEAELTAPSTVYAERLRVQALLASQGGDSDAILRAFEGAEAAWSAAVSPGDARAPLMRLQRAEWLARRGDAASRAEARRIAGQVLAEVDTRIVVGSPWRERIARLQGR